MRTFDKVGSVALMLAALYLFGAAFNLWPGPPTPPPLSIMGFAFFGWGYNLWRRVELSDL